MKHLISKAIVVKAVGLFAVAGGLNACGGADSYELTPEEQAMIDGDGAELSEMDAAEFSEIEEALNSDTNCGTASPDKTFSAIISPAFTSPANYAAGRNSCEKAYFTRVTNYRSGQTTKHNSFLYAGTEPTTKAACEDTRLMVYAFEVKSDGTATYIGNKSRNGVWEPAGGGFVGSCALPWVNIETHCTNLNDGSFSLTTGKTYQFAVSARTNNAGNPVMQPIKGYSQQQTNCTVQ